MQLAGCIIKDKQGRVLLLHRNTARWTHWEIPGGKVDPGESAQQAAVREIAEELDVTVKIVRRIDGAYFEEDGEQHGYDWFEAEVTAGQPRIAEPQTFDGLEYFSLAQMHDMLDDLSSNAKNYVKAMQLLHN